MHSVFVAGVSEDNYWDDRGIIEVSSYVFGCRFRVFYTRTILRNPADLRDL